MKLSADTTFSTFGLDAEHFLRDVAVGYRYRYRYAETRFALRSFPIPGIQLLSARTERTVPARARGDGAGVGWGFYLLDRNLRHMSPDYFWA